MKLTRLLQRVTHSLQHRLLLVVHTKRFSAFKLPKILTRSYPRITTKRGEQQVPSLQILKIDIQILESELTRHYTFLGKCFYKKLVSKNLSTFQPKIKTTQNKIKALRLKIEQKKQQLRTTQKTLGSDYKSADL